MTYIIVALVTAVTIQAAAIVALLVQRSRRRLAERAARASAERLRLMAERPFWDGRRCPAAIPNFL
jgi:hypothetical protein